MGSEREDIADATWREIREAESRELAALRRTVAALEAERVVLRDQVYAAYLAADDLADELQDRADHDGAEKLRKIATWLCPPADTTGATNG